MKTHSFYMLSALVGFIVLASCSGPNDKLSHKWTVKDGILDNVYMTALDEQFEGNTDSVSSVMNKIVKEGLDGRTYDLHSDGTCTIHSEHGDVSGKWEHHVQEDKDGKKGIVTFSGKNGQLGSWEIYDDDLTPMGKDNFIHLTMLSYSKSAQKYLGDSAVVFDAVDIIPDSK